VVIVGLVDLGSWQHSQNAVRIAALAAFNRVDAQNLKVGEPPPSLVILRVGVFVHDIATIGVALAEQNDMLAGIAAAFPENN
jgi:hypothetical protein